MMTIRTRLWIVSPHCGGERPRCIHQRCQIVTKSRFLVDQTKLFKVDTRGPAAPLDCACKATDENPRPSSTRNRSTPPVVIFADFGYGVITGPVLDRVMPIVRPRVPIVTADVSGRQSTLLRFKGVDLLCPTEPRSSANVVNNLPAV